MSQDAREYGEIVDSLVGRSFMRSLALNSLKLTFGVGPDPRGTHYIWIDPPWEFHSADGLETTSRDYCEERYHEWSRLFDPIDSGVLASWNEAEDGSVSFVFGHGYRLDLPRDARERKADDWYTHWYASDRTEFAAKDSGSDS